ncbi:MAG TPA: hypothetical protein VF997_23760 [Polyangia bacterium]
MRGRAPLALVFAFAVAAVGCGSGTSSRPATNGVLWLSWTIKGAAVSDTTCKGIDHLFLTMDTSAGAVTIEPIPCLRGLGWEYDGLIEGNNVVVLDALDANGVATLEGVASVAVTGSKPPAPVPVDLQPR